MGGSSKTLAERMMARFEGFDGAHGTYRTDGRRSAAGKATGKGTTVREPVTLALWEQHLEGTRSLGVIPIRANSTCSWGCIDIDTYPLDHAALVAKIKKLGLPLVVARSKSGGAHLFLFLTEPAGADLVQDKLRQMAATLGWGRAEVFPKQTEVLAERGDLGNWLNMPYFGKHTTRYGIKDDGSAMTLEEFLDAADAAAVTPDDLEANVVPEPEDEFKDGPPCLQLATQQGFPEGTRNNGLYMLGVFFKKAFPSEWEARLEEANRKYMDPPLGSAEVQTILKSLARKDYGYKCNDQPCASFCNASLCRTRKYGVGVGAGVEIRNLTKLLTDPPIWFVDVNGRRLELSDDDLMVQYRFQKRCLSALSILPPKMKEKDWQALLTELLANVSEQPVPAHVDPIVAWIERFCTQRAIGKTRDEIFLGKPVLWKDKVWVRAQDVEDFMRKNRVQFQPNRIHKVMRDLNAEDAFWNIRKRGVNVYGLPPFEAPDGIEPPDQEGEIPF